MEIFLSIRMATISLLQITHSLVFFPYYIQIPMFISRKTFRMRSNKNKIGNSQYQMESANPITVSQHRLKSDIEIVRYPAFFYLIAFLMMIGFIYLIYSANGGDAGIPGFKERQWWQYLLAMVPLVLSLLILIFSKIETVCLYGDKLQFCKTILLGFKNYQSIERQVSDLINIIIVKKGYEMVTFTNCTFFLVFNFKAYEQIEALECTSEITAIDYLSRLTAGLPNLRGGDRKITVKSIIET